MTEGVRRHSHVRGSDELLSWAAPAWQPDFVDRGRRTGTTAKLWKGRAGPLLGSGHSDEPDRAHGVQAAIATDRGLDGVGHRVDGPGDFGAGSYGGQPSSGNA